MARRAAARTRRNRTTGGAIRRLLGLLAFTPLASRVPTYGRLLWALVLDSRIPTGRKALLAAALGYVVLGRDIVRDDLPLVGGVDDLVVVALAVDVFLDGVPAEVLDDTLASLGITRTAFDEDVARVRRLLPAPLRRIARRLPEAIAFARGALQHSGLGPRLRGWLIKEGSLA